MNTYKLKAFNAIKRLKSFTQKKTSKTSNKKPRTNLQPCINQLYSMDLIQNGATHSNVVARYAGKSKSGKFFKFELNSFFTGNGIQIHLLCLNVLPVKMKALKTDFFGAMASHAA